MRLQPLQALAIAAALVLPLSAHAAWPAKDRTEYMKACEAQAQSQNKTVSHSVAARRCSCSADVIDQKFSSHEIAQLTSKTKAPPEALKARVVKEVQVCNTQRKG